jgi:hypothetical protein
MQRTMRLAEGSNAGAKVNVDELRRQGSTIKAN